MWDEQLKDVHRWCYRKELPEFRHRPLCAYGEVVEDFRITFRQCRTQIPNSQLILKFHVRLHTHPELAAMSLSL